MSRLKNLQEALQHAPDNVALLLLYGHGCLDELDLEDGRKAFQRVLELEPGHIDAQLGFAKALYLSGEITSAAVRLEGLLQQAPQTTGAYLLLSRIHLAENNRQKAIEYYTRAIEIDASVMSLAIESDLGVSVRSQPFKEKTSLNADLSEDDDMGEGAQELFEDPFEDASFEWRPETFFAPQDQERFDVDFSSVGGMEELKEEIRLKIIYPLIHPDLYKAYGKKTGGGILLYGPPGCGKSLLLRATAGEVACNYFAVGIHEIFDPYYGSIERNLHQIFETARANAPCVLVFDDIDSLAPDRRNLRDAQMRNVVNQFLSEMNGVQNENQKILVIGATNAPWQLDPALRRAGRFDQSIFVPPPDLEARTQIIELFAKDKPIVGLDAQVLAHQTEGFSGADLAWVFERAAEMALFQAFQAKKIVPIHMNDLLEVVKSYSPSTTAWLDGIKEHTPPAQQDALYQEVRKFMQTAAKS